VKKPSDGLIGGEEDQMDEKRSKEACDFFRVFSDNS